MNGLSPDLRSGSSRARWVYPATVWLSVLAVYLPIILSGRTLADNPALIDQTFNFMPNISWMAESWKAGLFPLWNPHTHFGMPQLAYTHCGGLYPVAVVLFTAWPYVWALSGMILFHALVAGTLVYLVLRGHGVEPLAATAGAVSFILSGSYFGAMYVFWSLGSISGFLAAWFCLRRLAARPGLPEMVGASLGLAWAGFSGDVEFLAYGLPLLFLVTLSAGPHSRSGLVRSSLLLALAGTAALLIVSALFLPTVEMIRHSIRGPAMTLQLAIPGMGETWPLTLPTLVFPFRYYRELFGTSAFNHGLPPGYQHFLAVWLFGLGLVLAGVRRNERTLVASAAILLAFFVLRELRQTGWIIEALPLVGDLHASVKVIPLIHLLVVIVAGRALTTARLEPRLDLALARLLVPAGAALIVSQPFCVGGPERYLIGAAAMVAGFWTPRSGRPGWRTADGGAARVAAILIIAEVLTLAWRQAPRTDPSAYELPPALAPAAESLTPEDRYTVFEPLLSEEPDAASPIYGLFELASGANNITGPARVQPARSFLFTSLFLPGIIYPAPDGRRILNLWDMANPSALDRGRLHLFNLAGTKLVLSRGLPVPYSSPYRLLLPGAATWRTVNFERAGKTAVAHLPALMSSPLSVLDGDRVRLSARSGAPAWVVVLRGTAESRSLLAARRSDAESPLELTAPVAALVPVGDFTLGFLPPGPEATATVSLLALELDGPARSLRRRERHGETDVFENRDALPRAFVVHRARPEPSISRLLEILSDPSSFRPLEEVWIEARELPSELPPPVSARKPGRVDIVKYGPQRVELSAGISSPGYLVLTDSWFPGWRARVRTDGGGEWESRILPADLAFRAVPLPRGRHFITFTYEPLSFRVGLWVSISALLVLVAVLARRLARRTA